MASFAPIRGTRAQIQATPIVDGQFLVETDQGVDNKIYMDEGSTRTIVGGNTVTGVLPELYIYSETGSVVTVEDAGGTSIPTSQVGTDHWICEVPDYGIYTVYSVLDGETTTQSVNVDDCMIYTIDDSHFHCNVVVTYPSGVGATCSITGGGETYSAPALEPPNTSYKFVVHGKNTTYTITTNVDGITKTATVTTGTLLDQTYNVTVQYAKVNLTVETPPIIGNITCTDGTTTITKPVLDNMVFYLDAGTWTISGSDGVESYSIEVVISDLTIEYNEDLSTAPDGATVLPTDDIQTWLLCAKIRDKTSYTTLDDVLNDTETLQKLIASNNATNYLVRSKTWIKSEALIPTMTDNTHPSGEASAHSTSGEQAYQAFDGNPSTGYVAQQNELIENYYLQYEFDSTKIVRKIVLDVSIYQTAPAAYVLGMKASNDNFVSDVHDLGVEVTTPTSGSNIIFTVDLNNNTAYKYYRLYIKSGAQYAHVYNSYALMIQGLQLYNLSRGITEDATAMRYIGEVNYASDTLLSDNNLGLIPAMEDATHPSGVVSSSSSYTDTTRCRGAYAAFDGSDYTCHCPAASELSENYYLQYKFDTPQIVKYIDAHTVAFNNFPSAYVVGIKGSNDGFILDEHDLGISLNCDNGVSHVYSDINNNTAYEYYRLYIKSGPQYSHVMNQYALQFTEIQLYSKSLNEPQWLENIIESDYTESILTNAVPIMTNYTTPSGEVIEYQQPSQNVQFSGFYAFDNPTQERFFSPANTGMTNYFVGYKFPTTVNKIYGIKMIAGEGQISAGRDYSIIVQNLNSDGTTWDNEILWTNHFPKVSYDASAYTVPLGTCGVYKTPLSLSNVDGLRINSGTDSWSKSGSHYIVLPQLVFYTRVDVDETVYHVYSAADDLVAITGNGVSLTCTTDSSGYGTITKSSLPAGTYTFTSSKAKDPSNLNDNYSDSSVVVNNKMIEIDFMPKRAIYWYGTEIFGLGIAKASSPNSAAVARTAPTIIRNTNTMNISLTGQCKGIVSWDSIPLSNIDTIKVLALQNSAGSFGGGSAYVANIDVTPVNSDFNATDIGVDFTTGTTESLFTYTGTPVSGSKAIFIYVGQQSGTTSVTVHALLVE